MKRKITSLAVLVLSLLMAAPALAEQSLTQVGEVTTAPEAGKYYVIQGNGQANQITWLFDNDGALAATESEEAPIGPEAMKYVWTFEVTDNGYAAQNLVSGRYGRTTLPISEEIRKKIIGDEKPITCRPADLIPPQLPKFEEECAQWKQQEEDVLSYALFPQVAVDFFKYRLAQQSGVDLTKADVKNGAYPA